jgi:hypothetical protein
VVGASEVVFEPPSDLEMVSADNRLVLRLPTRPPLISAGSRGTPDIPRPLVRPTSRPRTPAAIWSFDQRQNSGPAHDRGTTRVARKHIAVIRMQPR